MSTARIVEVPGSKSLTIRAVAASSLAAGESTISGSLQAQDTEAALRVFRGLGAEIEAERDWNVSGVAGKPTVPAEVLDMGESGLTTRIVIAVAGLVDGRVSISGRGRLPHRPMDEVLAAMRCQGLSQVSTPGDWPLILEGRGRLPGGQIEVDISKTSQALTGMLLTAPFAERSTTLVATGSRGSEGYVAMTVDVVKKFGGDIDVDGGTLSVASSGLTGTRYEVEPDASAAAYPLVAAAITGSSVVVPGLGSSSSQPDLEVAKHLEMMGCELTLDSSTVGISGPGGPLEPLDADLSSSPDGALGLAVACLFSRGQSRLRGLHSLRFKESDRVEALARELARVGAQVDVDDDALTITPGPISSGEISTYNDHRMAMSFGLLSLVDEGITVAEPEVVAKTWPGYWDMVASFRSHLV